MVDEPDLVDQHDDVFAPHPLLDLRVRLANNFLVVVRVTFLKNDEKVASFCRVKIAS